MGRRSELMYAHAGRASRTDIYNDHLHANMKQGAALPLRAWPQRAISKPDRAARGSRRADDRAQRPRPYPRALGIPARRRAYPCLVAIAQDSSGNAPMISASPTPPPSVAVRAAVWIEPPSSEECETDLFGEQVVLCEWSGRADLAPVSRHWSRRACAGNGYFECLHEVKLIVDLIYEVVASPT